MTEASEAARTPVPAANPALGANAKPESAAKAIVAPRIARFEAMVARFPDRSPPRFSLARALQDAGELAAAVPHYARAAELQPDLMMAWLHHAECLLGLQRFAEALPIAEEARRLAVTQGHEGPLADATELLEDLADELEG